MSDENSNQSNPNANEPKPTNTENQLTKEAVEEMINAARNQEKSKLYADIDSYKKSLDEVEEARKKEKAKYEKELTEFKAQLARTVKLPEPIVEETTEDKLNSLSSNVTTEQEKLREELERYKAELELAKSAPNKAVEELRAELASKELEKFRSEQATQLSLKHKLVGDTKEEIMENLTLRLEEEKRFREEIEEKEAKKYATNLPGSLRTGQGVMPGANSIRGTRDRVKKLTREELVEARNQRAKELGLF